MLFVIALGGCAWNNPANRPLLSALDEWVQPEGLGEKLLLGPIVVPAAVLCGALDIAVIHPLRSIVFGAEDTWRVLWAEPSGSFVERSLLFVARAAATPVVFAFCWFSESLFDLRPQSARTHE